MAPCLAPRVGMLRDVRTAENDSDHGICGRQPCGPRQRQHLEHATCARDQLHIARYTSVPTRRGDRAGADGCASTSDVADSDLSAAVPLALGAG